MSAPISLHNIDKISYVKKTFAFKSRDFFFSLQSFQSKLVEISWILSRWVFGIFIKDELNLRLTPCDHWTYKKSHEKQLQKSQYRSKPSLPRRQLNIFRIVDFVFNCIHWKVCSHSNSKLSVFGKAVEHSFWKLRKIVDDHFQKVTNLNWTCKYQYFKAHKILLII